MAELDVEIARDRERDPKRASIGRFVTPSLSAKIKLYLTYV